ncbi:thiamine pyrophosphate-dependent enzyme [Microbacterium sp. zg.B48]|nr:thiamine pyrophosphate-dependent enzyme [Microbacterium sp. zg.B48]
MLVDGFPDFGVDVPGADYGAIARAVGFHSARIQDPTQLRDAVSAALADPGPALVDIVTDHARCRCRPRSRESRSADSRWRCPRSCCAAARLRRSPWPGPTSATCAGSEPGGRAGGARQRGRHVVRRSPFRMTGRSRRSSARTTTPTCAAARLES